MIRKSQILLLEAVVSFVLLLFFTFLSHTVLAEETSQLGKHVFDLQYRPSGFAFRIALHQWINRVSFEKEPDFGHRDIVRGLIPVGPDKKEHVGFAWDRGEAKLYLDLNRNRDLTDDPNGAFQSKEGGRFQHFRDIPLELQKDSFKLPYMIQMDMYHYGRGSYSYSATIVSGFAAEIELYGRKWYVAVVDNMHGKLGPGDQFFLTPLGVDFGAGTKWHVLQKVPKNIFFDSHNYDLSFEFQAGKKNPSLQLTLTEFQRPMGRINIEGEYIARLALESASTTVLLDYPEKSVLIPAEDYHCTGIYLYGGDVGLFQPIRTGQAKPEPISVPEDGSATFKAGGPLKNTVDVKRTGSILTLDYKLIGADERSYERLYGRSDKPPTFTIYKSDRKIASGEFEYG